VISALQKTAAFPGALARAIREMAANEVERRRLPHVTFASDVILRGHVTAGKNVFLDHRAYLNCNGAAGFITLGDDVEIGPYSVIWGGGGVTIGNNVHIGTHVHITSMEGEQIEPETTAGRPLDITRLPVVVEDHVLIYSHAVIIPGVRIGHHAAVAAGAVVTQDVPPYALVAGVPARVVRYSNIESAQYSSA
jgi:serine acetyltransferase